MPVVHWLAMYLTDTFYPRYFFRHHNELFATAGLEMTGGQNNPGFGPVEWIWRQLTYGKLIKLWKPVKI